MDFDFEVKIWPCTLNLKYGLSFKVFNVSIALQGKKCISKFSVTLLYLPVSLLVHIPDKIVLLQTVGLHSRMNITAGKGRVHGNRHCCTWLTLIVNIPDKTVHL